MIWGGGIVADLANNESLSLWLMGEENCHIDGTLERGILTHLFLHRQY